MTERFVAHLSRKPLLVGKSDAIQMVVAAATRAARGNAKVLITGETGVGKDLVARFIHLSSDRRARPFLPLNCAGLTDTLLETELFGHLRGSFTGAHRDKVGKLQLAHRGTVFLDEVGEMSIRMQAVLLRFLENGEIQPVGSDAPSATVDVRIIAATNRNLKQMVNAGDFREDLLYRLDVVHIHIPPLRERPDDVPLIVEQLLADYGATCVMSPAAMDMMQQYSWPGNVREVQNVVEQMLLIENARVIEAQDLPAPVFDAVCGVRRSTGDQHRGVADQIFDGLVRGHFGFWTYVHPLFVKHDLTRDDLRQVIRHGLMETQGSYRALLRLFHMPRTDYKRFVSFLEAHECNVDFRPFRPHRE
jgi:two-component system, NtrC family, response regulator AtoC